MHLPEADERKERAVEAAKRVRKATSEEPMILEAYPNPSDGITYVVCNVPEGVDEAWVRVHDLNGRVVTERRIASGAGIIELDLSQQPTGLYAAQLRLYGVAAGNVKLAVE